ncbi:CLUMA_CG019743, isoform A [Clunio marinus]|uniref:CLUMA_CG019743, isoform A n=1 Tax=Clunio marinus TaxID=568069 RepID=A0A1J1J2H2_9DIPT|nr:CLUMA_CG019743, isoform A [Clunio marinus]
MENFSDKLRMSLRKSLSSKVYSFTSISYKINLKFDLVRPTVEHFSETPFYVDASEVSISCMITVESEAKK